MAAKAYGRIPSLSPYSRYLMVAFLTLIVFGVPARAEATSPCSGIAVEHSLTPVGNDHKAVSVYRPTNAAGALPLIVLLHGSHGSGGAFLAETSLATVAERHAFMIAAPDGGIAVDKGFAWNIPGVPTVAGSLPKANDRDDVAFIGAVIDQLVAAGCVDPERVYATGVSGGGRMASWLGCVAASRFAAIAPVVGLRAGNPSSTTPAEPDPASCKPSRPVPILAFAGDRDTTNPIAGGGARYWGYGMHAAERRWATLNGCLAVPTTVRLSVEVYEQRYSDCRDDADVRGRITIGGGHNWSVVDDEALWSFFAAHRRVRDPHAP